MSQKAYYAVIPADVRYCRDIPDGAKLLFGEITALCNERGYCWASNSYFAELYQTAPRTIQRWVQALAAQGFVDAEVSRAEGNKRRLTLTTKMSIPYDKNVVTSRQKCRDPQDKNVAHNNKKNIKENIPVAVTEVFEEWKRVLNHPMAQLDGDRVKRIQARLAEGFTPEQLKRVPHGVLRSPHHMGQNDRRTKYHKIETVFRDREQVEHFIELDEASRPKQTSGRDYAAEYMEDILRRAAARQEASCRN